MDLVAGDAREILLAIGVDDWAGLRDQARFPAYVSFGGGMDPQWLDLFAQAARTVTGYQHPGAFTESCSAIDGPNDVGERTVERVDHHWIDDVAILPTAYLDRIAARWIDLIELEECCVDPEEKPMFRELAADLMDFCRRARGAEDVIFAWTL